MRKGNILIHTHRISKFNENKRFLQRSKIIQDKKKSNKQKINKNDLITQ